jgi:hypothetical protein
MTLVIPTVMHGHPVVRYHYTPRAPATRAGYVILVQRSGDYLHPFVTGWVGLNEEEDILDKEWCYGHYLREEEDAIDDFNSRCRRGY